MRIEIENLLSALPNLNSIVSERGKKCNVINRAASLRRFVKLNERWWRRRRRQAGRRRVEVTVGVVAPLRRGDTPLPPPQCTTHLTPTTHNLISLKHKNQI